MAKEYTLEELEAMDNDEGLTLEELDEMDEQEVAGPLKTGLMTAADELLLNYGAEAVGAAKAPFSDLPLKEAYISERDAAERALLASQEANPTAATLGKVAGVGASLAIPMPALQGGRIAKAAKSAALGAGQFLAQDSGSIQGEVMEPGELVAQKVDLVTENPWSAALSTVLPASFAGSNFKKSGAERVFEATPPKSKDAQRLLENELKGKGFTASDLGTFAIEKGLAKPFTSASRILEKTYENLNATGEKIGQMIADKSAQAEQYLTQNAGKVSADYLSKTISPSNAKSIISRVYQKVKNRPEGDAATEYVADFINRNVGNKSLTLPEVQKLKVEIDDMIDWSLPDNKIKNKALLEFRTILDEAIEAEFDLLDKALRKQDATELKKLKKDYQKYSIIYENAKRRQAKEMSKTMSVGVPASFGAAAGAAGGTASGAAIGAAVGAGAGMLASAAQSGRLNTALGNLQYNLGQGGRITQAPAAIGARTADEPMQSEMSALQRYRLEKQMRNGR